MGCRNHIERYEELRSESAFLAPERHRLQDQDLFLAFEARAREYQHHQEVTVIQKNLETASKLSQEIFDTKTLSDEKSMLRKGLVESGKLSQSTKDVTSEQFEEIHDLRTTVALHPSTKRKIA